MEIRDAKNHVRGMLRFFRGLERIEQALEVVDKVESAEAESMVRLEQIEKAIIDAIARENAVARKASEAERAHDDRMDALQKTYAAKASALEQDYMSREGDLRAKMNDLNNTIATAEDTLQRAEASYEMMIADRKDLLSKLDAEIESRRALLRPLMG